MRSRTLGHAACQASSSQASALLVDQRRSAVQTIPQRPSSYEQRSAAASARQPRRLHRDAPRTSAPRSGLGLARAAAQPAYATAMGLVG